MKRHEHEGGSGCDPVRSCISPGFKLGSSTALSLVRLGRKQSLVDLAGRPAALLSFPPVGSSPSSPPTAPLLRKRFKADRRIPPPYRFSGLEPLQGGPGGVPARPIALRSVEPSKTQVSSQPQGLVGRKKPPSISSMGNTMDR